MKIMKGVIIRSIAIVLLVATCLGAVLYVDGIFEFSFIDRHPAERPENTSRPSTQTSTPEGSASATTKDPDITRDPDESTSLTPESGEETGSGETGESGTSSPVTGEETTPGAVTEAPFTPPSVLEYQAGGYNVTYSTYKSSMVLGEVTLPQPVMARLLGKKIFRESVKGYIYSDETLLFGDMKMSETDRFALETYMGYIIIAAEGLITVYNSVGTLVFETTERLSPAYARDKADRPLFFINGDECFYYIDETNRILYAAEDYNDDNDNRGLYFNYNPSYGKTDNGIQPAWDIRPYQRTFVLDMDAAWHKFNASGLIAKELYLMYPRYATVVARYNLRFADALEIAKKEIEEEESRRQESINAAATATPEISDTAAVPTEPQAPETNLVPAEITVEETVVSPTETPAPTEQTPAEQPSAPVTDAPSEPAASENPTEPSVSEPLTSPPESVPGSETLPENSTSLPEETTSPYPSDEVTGIVVTITKDFNAPRFGYMNGENVALDYAYARSYSFSGGRAAVVDDDGRMVFLNTSFRTSITAYRQFSEPVQGGNSHVWYYASYYEPVYRDERSIGSYYFDNGYCVVREVSIEKMRERRVGYDETFVINTKGTKIEPPSGFKFVACTEGIMLVERNGRYGYYDLSSDTWVANPIYTHAEPFYEGIAVVGTENGMGAIDNSGNEILPLRFEYVSEMSTGLISTYRADEGWRVFAKMSK